VIAEEFFKIVEINDDYIIVNKYPGIITEPAKGFLGPNLTEELSKLRYQTYVVSRLDVGTSGLILFPRNESSYEFYKEKFKNHEMNKTYYALVQGKLTPKKAIIEGDIKRKPGKDMRFGIVSGGKEAVTKYEVIDEFSTNTSSKMPEHSNSSGNFNSPISLVKLSPQTGRTHQIRVHLSSIKHPIIGDSLYGANPKISDFFNAQRPLLHSQSLEFEDVNGISQKYSIEFPEDFKSIFNQYLPDTTNKSESLDE